MITVLAVVIGAILFAPLAFWLFTADDVGNTNCDKMGCNSCALFAIMFVAFIGMTVWFYFR